MITSVEKTKEILTRLALGIIQQENHLAGDKAVPLSVLHPYIRQAWEYFNLCAYTTDVSPSTTLSNFINQLHTPVQDWHVLSNDCRALGLDGPIINEAGLSPVFRALAERLEQTYNPHLESEDENFRALFDACKQYDDARSYSALRTFLIQNCVYDDLYALEDTLWLPDLRPYLERCYEFIPRACIRRRSGEQYIVRCPHCGWALIWRRDGSAYCHDNGVCAQLYHPLSDFDQPESRVSFHDGMVRTKEGIQRFVVAPEVALIAIQMTLQELSQDFNITSELFPHFDSYDLLLTLPDGTRWAVDVKDWRSAVSLAIGISDTRFRFLPEWDKAFYVFPDYRVTSSYLNEFKNYWQAQKDVQYLSQGQFLQRVRSQTR